MNKRTNQSVRRLRISSQAGQNNPGSTTRPDKPKGPRYWRTIWRKAVEVFYGNSDSAERWFESVCPALRVKPIELVQNPDGRAKIAEVLDKLERDKLEFKPRTAWHACRAIYPSNFNGDLLFRNTEIPATRLFSHLRRGGNIQGFLREYPGISPEQVDAVFELIILDLCDFT